MASAQELYRWNPLQGQYSGSTNAIRAAQSIGTALDNLGVRGNDIANVFAERAKRIQDEEQAYNNAQIASRLNQINSAEDYRNAQAEGLFDPTYWFNKYGNRVNYKEFTDLVTNTPKNLKERGGSLDEALAYTPDAKVAMAQAAASAAIGDAKGWTEGITKDASILPASFVSKNSAELPGNVVNAGTLAINKANQQLNERKFDSAEAEKASAEIQTLFGEFEDVLQKQQRQAQGVSSFLGELGGANIFDKDGNVLVGGETALGNYYNKASSLGFVGSPEAFRDALKNGTLSASSFNSPISLATDKLNVAKARINANPYLRNIYGAQLDKYIKQFERFSPKLANINPTEVQQPTALGRGGQQQQAVQGQVGAVQGGTQGGTSSPNSINLGALFDSNNPEAGTKLAASMVSLNLDTSPQIPPLSPGTALSALPDAIDNLAAKGSMGEVKSGGVDFTSEFNGWRLRQGDAKNLQASLRDSVNKFKAQMRVAAAQHISNRTQLDVKAADKLFNAFQDGSVPDKIKKEFGYKNKEELIEAIQYKLRDAKSPSDINGMIDDLFKPLVNVNWNDTKATGYRSEIMNRIHTAVASGNYNPEHIAMLVNLVGKSKMEDNVALFGLYTTDAGNTLKASVAATGAFGIGTFKYMKDLAYRMRENDNYFDSKGFKAAFYNRKISTKDFSSRPITIHGNSKTEEVSYTVNPAARKAMQDAGNQASATHGNWKNKVVYETDTP